MHPSQSIAKAYPTWSFDELARLLQFPAGSERRLLELAKNHLPRFFSLGGIPQQDAEDLVETIFLELMQVSAPPQGGLTGRYLKRTFDNKRADYWRKVFARRPNERTDKVPGKRSTRTSRYYYEHELLSAEDNSSRSLADLEEANSSPSDDRIELTHAKRHYAQVLHELATDPRLGKSAGPDIKAIVEAVVLVAADTSSIRDAWQEALHYLIHDRGYTPDEIRKLLRRASIRVTRSPKLARLLSLDGKAPPILATQAAKTDGQTSDGSDGSLESEFAVFARARRTK